MTALAAIERLKSARFDGRPVLPAGTTRNDVEAGLGPSGPGLDGHATIGADAATMREYPPNGLAPDGCTAYFRDDDLLLIEFPYPELPSGWDAALGIATEKRSALAPAHMERSWAEAGVIVHQHRVSGEVIRLDALAGLRTEDLADEPPPRRERR